MVRFFAIALLASRSSGARVVRDDLALGYPHPVPTPDGYEYLNITRVHMCYSYPRLGYPSEIRGFTSLVPFGYEMKADEKCPGEDLTSMPQWGADITDITECAHQCNQVEECAGFDATNGACAHWRAGDLRTLQGTPREGHICYIKKEVHDLSGETSIAVPSFTTPTTDNARPRGKQVSDCLCVFDIDRTLTTKQGWHDNCSGTIDYPNIMDYSYSLGGETLILSDLAANLRESFCGQCYFSIVSAGIANGPNTANREVLDNLPEPKYNVGDWVDGCPHPVWGTKVMCCSEGHPKRQAVRDVVTWLDANGVHIEDSKVHFFDDKEKNIKGFEGTPFNAHMVSCGSRDGSLGGCGGVKEELVDAVGTTYCNE